MNYSSTHALPLDFGLDEKSVIKNHGVIVSYVLISYNETHDVITHSLFCVSQRLKISTPKNASITNLLERWEGGRRYVQFSPLEMDE